MKLMGFDRGVTLLGGFPFPICTPAHGTAYDIAGKGIASVGATRAALLLAAEMAVRRRRVTGGADERIPAAAAERGRGRQ
jgi:4-hydroxythreonine-4-phosphate dehydrogenase